VAYFHLAPFTPSFGKVFDILEVDLSGLLENLAGTSEIRLRFACCSAFFVKLGKVDIQAVEIRCGSTRSNTGERLCVSFCDLPNSMSEY